MTRRLALAAAATVVAGSAWAQAAWPTKPITLIVPFPPGGPTDVVSRIVGKELSDRLGQPIIVENKSGASGAIAAGQVKRAAPDGYTLMTLATPTLFAPLFYKNTGYEVTQDFTPIAMIYDLPIVMVVNPEKLPGVTTLQQLIDTARAQKGALNYTTSGAGSFGHMSMELLKDLGKFDMQHVAYKGGVPAITDTIGGQVPIMYADLVAALPHIKSGKLVAVAVGSPERVAMIPEVKTIAEQGIHGFSAVSLGAFLGPKGLPPAVVERLNKELKEILSQKAVQDRILGAGAIARYLPAAQLQQSLTTDYAKWSKVVREKGMAAE
ncbi:tripartite tricarboxylate transporter substrate binding protein [Comamonas aquatica]|jgi:tripartite-type tricarboxylate transporter receptor subunit TctC|uniref:Tripartite tricarboxylate transporter substrate binding protein n=2 Tax=Comamonadaceae TaxID=80864 RepID=A0AA42HVR0_9BURK|nr:tripartite tricarboxylate transporter substrate binding protein [Comamonas aquatica]MDE1556941.1 tripartite tricarboxylate transporter substrate binding protein [Comamonas aquatica]MDH0365174.1 tripartite tricarboxylate transporter substrate binding protein [Comamonas aquatica]MDH1429792.1 tripartite tricarboxylate transporter substrate binding protein [Comamonas aquatica]MDH1606544.1 tripartite tricarboxylate transporter substrate binding protein [Comamonas aquatica]MDH1619299.1 tripartite